MECMDELKSCPMLAKTCKGVTDSAPCLALCDLCHESCGLCDGPSVTHQPPVTVPPTMAMTTLDEHGFSAEQLKASGFLFSNTFMKILVHKFFISSESELKTYDFWSSELKLAW